jgi:hypothetical protein
VKKNAYSYLRGSADIDKVNPPQPPLLAMPNAGVIMNFFSNQSPKNVTLKNKYGYLSDVL